MRTIILIGCLAVVAGATFIASANAAGLQDQSVTVRGGRGGGIDFNFAPPDQQPACLIAIGGIVNFSADVVEHANRLTGDVINVAGNDRVEFTAGDYTASVAFSYSGTGVPNPNGEVLITTPIDVDLVSPTGDVVPTTWSFSAGANVIPDFGLVPFSLALPNYTDVTCR
jgi:hypothetical protein